MVSDALRFSGFVRSLQRWGIEEMLVFLLIFVIIYAVLQKTKILGESKKNLNVLVALVVGALVIVPHITGRFPANADPVQIIMDALPQVSLVIVAIIFLLILIGVFGQEQVFLGMSMPGWIAAFSFVVILIIFGGAAGWWTGSFGRWMEDFFGTEGIAVAVMLLVFGIIIAWITHDDSHKSTGQSLGVDFSKLFGGGKSGGGGGH